MLNKYPVIAQHFILATKAFKEQTDLLEEDDLALTHACLKAWDGSGDDGAGATTHRLFAFFNSGARSGASQPHRHVQFLPVEEMGGVGEAGGWGLLADRVLAGPRVERGECVGVRSGMAVVLRGAAVQCANVGLFAGMKTG